MKASCGDPRCSQDVLAGDVSKHGAVGSRLQWLSTAGWNVVKQHYVCLSNSLLIFFWLFLKQGHGGSPCSNIITELGSEDVRCMCVLFIEQLFWWLFSAVGLCVNVDMMICVIFPRLICLHQHRCRYTHAALPRVSLWVM